MTDDAAVARFEQLLHAQPEPHQWSPVTAYDYESRRIIEGKHPDIIVETFGKGPYLDYGCGPDAILVRLLRERGVMAYGIDPQLKDEWRCFGPRWDSTPKKYVGDFPVVICREVLEHVRVAEMSRLIQRWSEFQPTFIYVTTRFAKQPDHLLAVEDEKDVDPTHVTCLTKPFLRLLFVLAGGKSRPDLEAKLDWQQKGRCLVFEFPRD